MQMDELLDVVDKNDEVIGKARYSECHKKGLIHRSSSIFVFRDSSLKEILLIQRSLSSSEPGKFGIIGGHVKSGDGYLKTAKEELHEEIFWNHEMPKKLELKEMGKVFYNDMPGNYEFGMLYYTIHPGPFFPNPQETKGEIVFHKLESVVAERKKNPDKFTGAFLVHLDKLLEYLGQ